MHLKIAKVSVLAVLMLVGCRPLHPGSLSWHQKFDWKAEKYFDDPQVIALCNAIEANDLGEMERLIQAGADVNAKGKGNMTPLLWAYPDNKPDRLKLLLELGADPNVNVTQGFDTGRQGIRVGDSVTTLAVTTSFPNYFEHVFQSAADPNHIHPEFGDTPIFEVIRSGGKDKLQRLQLLLDRGANLDHINELRVTPAMQAVSWGGQYDVALWLLEAGADPDIDVPDSDIRLGHIVVADKKRHARCTPEQLAQYDELVTWLNDHGELVTEAEADILRWKQEKIGTPK